MAGKMVCLALAAAFAAGGCGTAANLRSVDDRVPFGGVRWDIENISYNADSSKPRMFPLLCITATLIDLPFTTVGDVVTWPFVVASNVSRGINNYYHPRAPDRTNGSAPVAPSDR